MIPLRALFLTVCIRIKGFLVNSRVSYNEPQNPFLVESAFYVI